MTTKSKVTIEHVISAIVGLYRMGCTPYEILGALYEHVHSVGFVNLTIKNYLNKLK